MIRLFSHRPPAPTEPATLRALKWNGRDYRLARRLLNRRLFREWAEAEGRSVLEEEHRRLHLRWLFGRGRARRRVYRQARMALAPRRGFAVSLKRDLGELPGVVRRLGVRIRRRDYHHLYTVDRHAALVTVPRAVVRHEFSRLLLEKLGDAGSMERFTGLSKRICRLVAAEAEQLLCSWIAKGKPYVFDDGRATLMAIGFDYRWGFHELDGHYHCAYTGREGRNLTRWWDNMRFKAEIAEILGAHETHLARLPQAERERVVEELRALSLRRPSPRPADVQLVEAYVPGVFTT